MDGVDKSTDEARDNLKIGHLSAADDVVVVMVDVG
jgi:hypothetical protein